MNECIHKGSQVPKKCLFALNFHFGKYYRSFLEANVQRIYNLRIIKLGWGETPDHLIIQTFT